MVSPIRDHTFFEQPQFESLLGNDFLQVLRLAPELSHPLSLRPLRKGHSKNFLFKVRFNFQ